MEQIDSILQTTMSEIKKLVDVNTIVGNPVVTQSGCTVIPVSRVSLGLVTGGGEYGSKYARKDSGDPFAGGTASGVSITPVAFLVVEDEKNVRVLAAGATGSLEKLVDNAPRLLAEIKTAVMGDKQNA